MRTANKWMISILGLVLITAFTASDAVSAKGKSSKKQKCHYKHKHKHGKHCFRKPASQPSSNVCKPQETITINPIKISGNNIFFNFHEVERVLKNSSYEVESATLEITVQGRNHKIDDFSLAFNGVQASDKSN